jgi:7,8-dihydropterin-6-yl-methyl-4-(beta-D-ribofuranosyl)aminobenzene 5'-phosphate synthase
MCDEPAGPRQATRAAPRPVTGPAADPITLAPVDEVVITTLVDNVYDALLTGDDRTTRAPFRAGMARAAQFEGGSTTVGLMAEHGFSALVSVRRGSSPTTLLFDTGLSPDAMMTNASRLGVDFSAVQAVVLSHGHFDHAGGLAGLAGRRGTRSLPMVIHPLIWTRRRLAVPGREPEELPTLSPRALQSEGFELLERRQPSLLAGGCVLITGEVDRTTDFEHGMPPSHQARDGARSASPRYRRCMRWSAGCTSAAGRSSPSSAPPSASSPSWRRPSSSPGTAPAGAPSTAWPPRGQPWSRASARSAPSSWASTMAWKRGHDW